MSRAMEPQAPPFLKKNSGAVVSDPIAAAAYSEFGDYNEVNRSNPFYWLSTPRATDLQVGNAYSVPHTNVFDAARLFGAQAKSALNQIVTIFFRNNRQLLEAVFITRIAGHALHYSIVLREDTDENRATIFSILEEPEIEELSSEHPVYFQFYSQKLKNRIKSDIMINL